VVNEKHVNDSDGVFAGGVLYQSSRAQETLAASEGISGLLAARLG